MDRIRRLLFLIVVTSLWCGCSGGKDANDTVTPLIDLGQKTEFTYSRDVTSGHGHCSLDLMVNLTANKVDVSLGSRVMTLALSGAERTILSQVFSSVQLCPPCLSGHCHTHIETCPDSEYVTVQQDDVLVSIDCLSPLCNSERNKLLWSTIHQFADRNGLTSCP